VIVTLSGWLYIVLPLFALRWFTSFHGASEKLAFLAWFAFSLVVGVGLLSRLNWARWLTLGVSLLSWTLTPLVFFWQMVQFLRLYAHIHGGLGVEAWVTIVVVVAAYSAFVWLSFKLFRHLNSDEGRFEFDTPETETYGVTKSAALQIAWSLLSTLMVEPGLLGVGRSSHMGYAETLETLERLESELTSAERAREVERRRQANDSALRDLEQQAELVEAHKQEARARQLPLSAAEVEYESKARELLARRGRDRSYTDAEFEADKKAIDRELSRSLQTPTGTSPRAYSEPTRQPSSASERAPSAVLKCRDASGAISFTQGYCPTGTTLVESRPTD
jgi:hypothetical protein